ncbi:MAG: zinc ribbon domain-containing protein [Solirubrobacteraceae bacterium]|nr:zinc ribbon domain-containing protein [Solirubrobacteraceae bacterium]
MSTFQVPVSPPRPSGAGEACPSCGSPMADDQRYCLECGERRGAPRVAIAELTEPVVGADTSPVAAPPPADGGLRLTPVTIAAGGGAALLLLLLGALISSALSDPQINVPAAKAPIVTVSAPAAAPAATPVAAPVAFVSDWSGDDGWTVQLQALPKDGTDPAAVAAAKAAATAKGAPDVGALDADEYASLDGGEYLVYSGTFPSKKAAQAAAKELKTDFPDAKAVEVSTSADSAGDAAAGSTDKPDEASPEELNKLENSSGDDYVKQSKKLKDTTVTPGEAPPVDDKPAGGGDEGETIG